MNERQCLISKEVFVYIIYHINIIPVREVGVYLYMIKYIIKKTGIYEYMSIYEYTHVYCAS